MPSDKISPVVRGTRSCMRKEASIGTMYPAMSLKAAPLAVVLALAVAAPALADIAPPNPPDQPAATTTTTTTPATTTPAATEPGQPTRTPLTTAEAAAK